MRSKKLSTSKNKPFIVDLHSLKKYQAGTSIPRGEWEVVASAPLLLCQAIVKTKKNNGGKIRVSNNLDSAYGRHALQLLLKKTKTTDATQRWKNRPNKTMFLYRLILPPKMKPSEILS